MKIDILKEQILLAKKRTDGIIADFVNNKWSETPDILKSNLNWQMGHIILANYLHGIASITGMNVEFREKVKVADYIKFYGLKSNPSEFTKEKPSRDELMSIYEYTLTTIVKSLENMDENELDNKTEVPNPAAKTKYQALMWLSQHQSWHNGQIAMLKRVVKG